MDVVLVEASKKGKVLLINTSLRLNSLVTEQRQLNVFLIAVHMKLYAL